MSNDEQVLDISVSQTQEFSGHYEKHNVIPMKIKDFLDYEGQLTLYLAQHPVYNQKKSNDIAKNLNERKLNFPSFLRKCKNKIKLVNIWASKKKTNSFWHFDAYNNFNFMLKGSKTFKLANPNSNFFKAQKIESWSSNHAAKVNFPKKSFQSKKIRKL